MRRSPCRNHPVSSFAMIVVAVVVALAAPLPAQAQSRETGTMAIRVVDPDGAALPGATVSIAGPLGSRSDITTVDGTVRVPGLYPGDYTATISLSGFKTIIREDLRVSVGRTVSLTINLELSAVAETITVTGESPVVDVKSTTMGSLYTDQLIDMTPTSSGIWAGVLDHVPGLVSNEVDVAGGESGQQGAFRAYGGVGGQNVYNVNGANATDPVSLGATAAYYSTASFEEVGVSTGGHDVETQGAGVSLNMVTKSGSNDWKGAVKFFGYNDGFVSNNVDQALMDAGVSEGNPNTLLTDLNAQIGGPILRNRAWFFVDYWDFQVERKIIGLPENERDDTTLRNWTLNGTWQANQDHKFNVRYMTDRKFRGNRGASRTTPPETARIQDSFVDIPQVQWQGVMSQNTFTSVTFNKLDNEFFQKAKRDHPNFVNLPFNSDFDTGLSSRIASSEPYSYRDRGSLNGSVTHYVAMENQSHDLKVGGELARLQDFSPTRVPFGLQTRTDEGAGVRVRFYNSDVTPVAEIRPPDGEQNKSDIYALFAQDSWTINNRLTINGGVRWDWSNNYYPEQVRPESFWPDLGANFQRAVIPASGDITVWNDFSPRISAVYDLRGDGRTAVKAGYSRYSEAQGLTWARRLNPAGIGFEEWFWTDANNDGIFQRGEETSLRRVSFPGITESIDPDLESPLTDEVTVGMEHEVFNNFLFSANYIWRDRKNNIEEINVGVPYGPIAETLGVPDSYIPVLSNDPGPDGIFGNADDGGPITVFSQRPETFGNNDFFITNPENFGFDQLWNFKGVELIFQKRWSDNWQMLASYNWGKAIIFDDVGDGPNSDIGRNGVRSSYDRPHVVKFTGNYLFAEPVGVNIGAFLRLQSGQGRIRAANFRSAQGLAQGTTSVRVAPRRTDTLGPAAYDTLAILDLRAEKQVSIGRYGVLHFYFDAFNVFNENTVLSARGTSSSTFDQIFSIVPPRVLRIGGAWDF